MCDRRYQGGAYAAVEQVVLEALGSSPGRRTLEVGCGTGHWLKLLHEHGFDVTGLDASPTMLEQARLPAATLLHGTAERLPLRGDRPRSTSQLAVLPPEAFAQGVDRIRQEEAKARDRGEALALTAELHFWATTARKP
ncbi:class I SAM-dependent methyltransferase [Sorangium sp. So ce1128]